MKLTEMLAIKPSDYLVNGFYNEKGEENLNGLHSLAMAYRIREEGLNPENVDVVVNHLEGIAEKQINLAYENPEQAVDPKLLEQLKKLRNDQSVADSPALIELLDAAQPRISNWKEYSAFVVHLVRITSQLALLKSLPEKNIAKS